MFEITSSVSAEIVNLTPHSVNMIDEDGAVMATYLSAGAARAASSAVVVGLVNGIEVVSMSFGEISGLPEPTEGKLFVVSRIVAEAAIASGRGADDLLLTADTVRGEDGQIIGCKRFSRL